MQCGELLLSKHKTLDSFPWTTTIETYLNGSDVQPGLEVSLWVSFLVLGWITSSSSVSVPDSGSETEVGLFVYCCLKRERMKGTPGEKCLELFFLTQVPLLQVP